MAASIQIPNLLLRRPRPLSTAGMITGSLNVRPLWFDGRFLAARDLKREQRYFLHRQAELGQAGGFGVVHGLIADQGATPDGETLVIHAGHGITPSGELVMLSTDLTIELSDIADEENLNGNFGLSENPQQPARTRTGIYVLALRPVEFTANPVSSYPTNLSDPRVTADGDVVEATAAVLIPYPNPVNSFDANIQQAALARQIFVEDGGSVSAAPGAGPASSGNAASAAAGTAATAGTAGVVNNSVLPIAMLSIDRNVIQWIDCYLVRRDAGPEYGAIRPGLPDAAAQQAYLLQYDAQLQQIAAARQTASLNLKFAATDYFQSLPSAGRVPLDAIDTAALTQTYFPQQANVSLSLVPQDELPAVLEDSISLPPLDLTLTAASFSNVSIYVLIPVARNNYASLSTQFPPVTLRPALPQTIANRPLIPVPLLFPIPWLPPKPAPPSNAWTAAINGQTYGFYVLRRSEPVFPGFA